MAWGMFPLTKLALVRNFCIFIQLGLPLAIMHVMIGNTSVMLRGAGTKKIK